MAVHLGQLMSARESFLLDRLRRIKAGELHILPGHWMSEEPIPGTPFIRQPDPPPSEGVPGVVRISRLTGKMTPVRPSPSSPTRG